MGSSSRFHEIFTAEPRAAAGVPFARFMELALYHPEAGYYARDRPRIGRDTQSDFYTATSLGPLFGELVAAAAVTLLGPLEPADFIFVEIGAEPIDKAQGRPLGIARDRPFDGAQGGPLGMAENDSAGRGVLRQVAHRFGGYRTISLGEQIVLPPRCIVFSNELFDAIPCHRLVGRDGAWRELGVAWRDGALVEVELPAFSAEVATVSASLPSDPTEGYHLDLPLRSVAMLQQIASQSWHGLFLAFDYGKSWRELTAEEITSLRY